MWHNNWRVLHLFGSLESCSHEVGKDASMEAPTELARRPTWEMVATNLCCQGDMHGIVVGGPAQQRLFWCKKAF